MIILGDNQCFENVSRSFQIINKLNSKDYTEVYIELLYDVIIRERLDGLINYLKYDRIVLTFSIKKISDSKD